MSPLAKWHRSEKGLTERSVLVIFSKTRYCCPPPNFILFQVDFDVKFPLLRLLLFLIDLKSTIFLLQNTLNPFYTMVIWT